jgi:hypothetical protein
MYDLVIALVFIGIVVTPAVFAARAGARATREDTHPLLPMKHDTAD